jgi:PAS domain S-box-containing protein
MTEHPDDRNAAQLGDLRTPAASGRWAILTVIGVLVAAGVGILALSGSGRSPQLLLAVGLVAMFVLGLGAALIAQRGQVRRIERELDRNKVHMQLVADSAPQVLWQGLNDGRVTFMNLRWTELTGASVEDGIADDGWAWQNWFHPEDRQGLLDDWERARTTGQRFDSYRRLMTADGAYRWLQITAQPIRSSDGEVVRWYGVSTDIHAEMQAQLSVRALNQTLEQRVEERARDLAVSERRYRSIFRQSNVAMIEQDVSQLLAALKQGAETHGTQLPGWLRDHPDEVEALRRMVVAVDANPAALRLFNESKERLLSERPPSSMATETFADFLAALVENRIDGWEQMIDTLTADGTAVRALCSVNLLESAEDRTRIMVAMIDVTDREQTREQLIEAHEELARANRALTMGALSMSLAHDLGQPISAITIEAVTGERFLRREPADVAAADQAFRRINANAQRAGDLLRRTREQLVRREREIEALNLREVIDDCVGLTAREFGSHNSRLEVLCEDDALSVAADRVELRQVLINLLLNALHAACEGGANDRTVTLELRAMEAGDVLVEVRDTGVGLPEGPAERVFEPLFSTKPGSMGMGLAICRNIIEGFGGVLTARNNPQGGATFAFRLPPIAAPDDPQLIS